MIWSAKTDPSGLNEVFGEGRLKDEFAFFEASKNPLPYRRKLLAKRPFLQAKRALFETAFELDRVSFSTPEMSALVHQPIGHIGINPGSMELAHSLL